MHKDHWIDLLLGTLLVSLLAWLWNTNSYTVEIGIMIGIMTIIWIWT
jgi:hypothetical protein